MSYDLWRRYAAEKGLPWKVVGTLKLAVEEEEVKQLDTYMRWSQRNLMDEDEVELLDAREVGNTEPHVACAGALHAKRETAVDFGAFTRSLRDEARTNGVKFLLNRRAIGLSGTGEGVEIEVEGSREPHLASFVINCAGGGAVDLAHSMGVGEEYTDLHFRGEYWRVGPNHGYLASRNVYTVPNRPEFPFLDPHWIVRVSGDREIGPNAVPVASPWTYEGFFEDISMVLQKFWEPPLRNKARLLASSTFLSLAAGEALGSISKSFLAARVQRFLPEMKEEMLAERRAAGIRSSVIDRRGKFVREAVELEGQSSLHILNYNSPGATGAPAYSATLLERLVNEGRVDHLRRKLEPRREPWDITKATVSST